LIFLPGPSREEFFVEPDSWTCQAQFKKVILKTENRMQALSAMEPLTFFLGLSSEDWRAVWLTVRVALLAVGLGLPFGTAFGWLLARKSFHGTWLVETLINLPLVLPPVVTGYLLLLLLGKRGLLGSWLYGLFGWESGLTWRGAVLAVAVMGFPLLV